MDAHSKKDRYKKILLHLADSGKYIPGIYNYCDRWCERCTMTAKCLTYAQEQSAKEETTDSETNDISNEKFWESIHMSFQVALELLYEDARRRGIDPDNLPEVERKRQEKMPVETIADQIGRASCRERV